MASLADKDFYLQKLAKKFGSQEVQESRKRKLGTGLGGSDALPKKKRKKAKKQKKMVGPSAGNQVMPKASTASPAKPMASAIKRSGPDSQIAPGVSPSAAAAVKGSGSQNSVPDSKSKPCSLFAMNVLRQRLHEKIQEVSGQGFSKELSPTVLEKRRRRKYEKERKKRRRKELSLKEKMEKEKAEVASTVAVLETTQKANSKPNIVFNKVEVESGELNPVEKRKEKRKLVKGNLSPLTGKNYKQLLSRLESRKDKLAELKEKDESAGREMEAKMKWTNVLYKAEGIKIRDDEDRLKAALKRKEKRKAQHKKQWENRVELVVEKMQQRQDKRRTNIQKKKLAKAEKKKAKARKKGRILPEDLEKAGFK